MRSVTETDKRSNQTGLTPENYNILSCCNTRVNNFLTNNVENQPTKADHKFKIQIASDFVAIDKQASS